MYYMAYFDFVKEQEVERKVAHLVIKMYCCMYTAWGLLNFSAWPGPVRRTGHRAGAHEESV